MCNTMYGAPYAHGFRNKPRRRTPLKPPPPAGRPVLIRRDECCCCDTFKNSLA